MECLAQTEKGKKSKKIFTVSSSGRVVKPPKHILTTSSDEAPVRKTKSSKSMLTMKKELERLRSTYGKQDKDTSKPIALLESENAVSKTSPNNAMSTYTDTVEKDSQETATIVNKLNVVSVSLPNKAVSAKDGTKRKHFETVSYDYDSAAELRTPSPRTSEDNSLDYLKEILEKVKIAENQNKEILIQNEVLKEQNEKIMEQLSRLNIGEEPLLNKSLFEPLQGFPLHTIDQFKKMETDSNKPERKKLYNHLRNLGGTKLREFLNSSLKETMTDELVNNFTWPGCARTEKLGDTKIANVLYMAAKNCQFFKGPDSKSHFKTEMQEVLRTTKQRFRNKMKKKLTPGSDKDDDDPEKLMVQIQQLQKIADECTNEDDRQVIMQEMQRLRILIDDCIHTTDEETFTDEEFDIE